MAYGSSWLRDQIWATAATKLHLQQHQILNPLWERPGIEHRSQCSQDAANHISPQQELLLIFFFFLYHLALQIEVKRTKLKKESWTLFFKALEWTCSRARVPSGSVSVYKVDLSQASWALKRLWRKTSFSAEGKENYLSSAPGKAKEELRSWGRGTSENRR